jgi:antitoxin (DNA-binding transcriptional repressor) of toxin-antitoxin stability system
VDEVHTKRETVIITKHGKPVAKLVTVNVEKDEIYDFLAGKGAIVGDIIAPALSQEGWSSLK